MSDYISKWTCRRSSPKKAGNKWEGTNSEKQLDNVTIGITDMQGNTYHYEVTTIPACTYYAVSIDSLPSGMYYLCVYQGSNNAIGMFTID